MSGQDRDITDDAWTLSAGDLRLVAGEEEAGEGALLLSLEHYEGPLDLLLALARQQKVDLLKISILELVEQYLTYIKDARLMAIELAADYLVMAAWLAYLKSRLLLPREDEEEPSAEELAARLQLRLQRLNAMREAGHDLMERARLGRDVFPRGAPEAMDVERQASYEVSQFELFNAFADVIQRSAPANLTIKRRPIYAIEEAVERLQSLIGGSTAWTRLQNFLPPGIWDKGIGRSATASIFAASLELAKRGEADLRQMEQYGPIYLRRRADDRDNQPEKTE